MNNSDNQKNYYLITAGRYLQALALVMGVFLLAQLSFVNSAESCDSILEFKDVLQYYKILFCILFIAAVCLIYLSGIKLSEAGKGLNANNRIVGPDNVKPHVKEKSQIEEEVSFPPMEFSTPKGNIFCYSNNAVGNVNIGDKVLQNDKPAQDGKYKLGFMWYIIVKEGRVKETTLF